MAKVDHTTSYYQKMAELQEKLKRSEEERFRLEEKFEVMIKSCREEEEKRITALRERYEKFLEDDKRRRDRNERILHTLEKIESRAAALTAKSERLKLLRKHYEAYLIRMYPLWKKQNSSVTQQPDLNHYPLSLPMDTDKSLSWFGNKSGMYANDLPSVQNSQIPGSDHLWMSPAFLRNEPINDNSNLSVHKLMEREDTVVETCSPAVENALDDYIHRAAELLRVPVEELEGHSEKCDEEKSVHTEQDTSRDLLNVSLSDDGILLEKKREKTIGNLAIVNTKEEMVDEHKSVPQAPDYLAGGDNALTDLQTTKQSDRFCDKDAFDKPSIVECYDDNEREHDPSSNKLQKNNMNEDTENSVQEIHRNQLDEERITDQNYMQDNFENPSQYYNIEKVPDSDEQYETIPHTEQIVNNTNIYQNDLVQNNDQNLENIGVSLEHEPTDEVQENVGKNELDIIQHFNSELQEYPENQELESTQILEPYGREQQPTDALVESYQENNSQLPEYTEEQFSNEQEYMMQNAGDVGQYGQEQNISNIDQPYEQYPNQYPDNTEQYTLEQSPDYVEQVYNQYQEQVVNEQYPENTGQFDELQAEGNYNENEENAYEITQENYEGQNTDLQPTGFDDNIDQEAVRKNTNESMINAENVNPEYNAETTEESPQYVEISQPVLPSTTEGSDLYNPELETPVIDDQMLNLEMEKNETSISSQLNEHETTNAQQQQLKNQEEAENYTVQEEVEGNVTENDMSQAGTQPYFAENSTIQPPATMSNVDITDKIEEDSEGSSAGFWNPPHHSSIPSVEELAPKACDVVEETSESSAESKPIAPNSKPPEANTVEGFRSLLGVPPEPSVDSSALSDLDEVEDQLAAIVEVPTSSTPAVVKSKQSTKVKEVKQMETTKKVIKERQGTRESPKRKSEKDSKSIKNLKSAKPPTRTGLKKPPSLIKVLESDTESLNLDSGGATNVDSDEFDFSTE